MKRLAGQVGIVTGGASGIGRAVALALAAEGVAVTIADLSGVEARAAAAEIAAAGGSAEAAAVDVTATAQVDALVERVAARRRRLDVLVCSAGVCRVKPVLELSEDDLTTMWRVHALGTFLCARAAAQHMATRGYGRIVAVVSGPSGYGASPWTAHYQAAKSAQTSLARSLALALGAQGITVNCVSPGLVVTPLWNGLDADFRALRGRTAQQEIAERLSDPDSYPLGRPVAPEEVANAVLFLCSPQSGAITGEVLNL